MYEPVTQIACPKCGGEMRPQERQGVVIDVCTNCRGVFLDRGELDRLLDMEASFNSGRYDQGGGRYDQGGRYDDRGRYDRRDRRRDDDDDDDRGPGGFLSNLLNFGD